MNWKLDSQSEYSSLIILLFLVMGLSTLAQTPLDNYLYIGAQNNPGLKSKFASYHASLEKVPQVGSLPNLNVAFGYFVSPIETRIGPQQAKISVSQMFPWFGTLNRTEDVYTDRAKADYEVFEERKSKLYFNIKSAYYKIYFVEKGIAITRENIGILQTFQQLALIKVETGKSSVVDELRVEMELLELENQLALLLDSKMALEVEFHQLINDSSNAPIQIPDSLWDENFSLDKNVILDSINTNNHLVKELDFKISTWQNAEIASRKTGGPQILLGVDYAFIGENDNTTVENNGKDAIMPMIGLSIPLYRKKYNALVSEASYNMQSAQFEKDNKQNELRILFEKVYRDYSDANRRIYLYQRQTALAKKSLNILLTSYSSDGKNFEEVLRMERKLLEFSLELDKARTDKNAAVAFVDYLMGK
ncbi:MAG: TolC family protein [Salibacteraceae bacterium]